MNIVITRSLTAVTFALTVATAQAAAPRYQLSELGTFGGPESIATAIDRSGLIVGYSNTPGVDSHYRAFGYAGGVMSDLGGLTEDGESFATAVNAAGGCSTNCDSSRAVPAQAVNHSRATLVRITSQPQPRLGSSSLAPNKRSTSSGTGGKTSAVNTGFTDSRPSKTRRPFKS